MFSLREGAAMRWNIGSHGHDPRLIDLVAAVALVVAAVAGWRYVTTQINAPPSATAFVEPSQTVHW